MKDLSLNLLDIAENSVKAGATLTQLLITEQDGVLTFRVVDDGCGMTEEVLKGVTDPFYTTRTTRKVGLGLPLLRMAAEQTGGNMEVASRHKDSHPDNHGTEVTAVFHTDHIDCPPVGDLVATVTTLIQGHPDTDFHFVHTIGEKQVELDTRQLREILGEVSLAAFEVLQWISGYLSDQYTAE
ncbi:MAG: sensor histidine kinase [Clostridia bacterium]|nr:sensor histidine kinase [Clostridia bacterium]